MIEHPFFSSADLEDKTIEEIQDSMANLNTKLTYAYRTQNQPLINQLQMILESHKTQYYKKIDEVFDKQKLKKQINIQSDKK